MENKATIERKDYVSELDGKTIYLCKITLPKRITEGDDHWIEFKKLLVLECYHIEENSLADTHRTATFSFDFGMTGHVQLQPQHNCILRGHENDSDEEKIVRDVIFDLFHAFFHVSDDPNYTDYHWALFGNLKDRVTTGDDYD